MQRQVRRRCRHSNGGAIVRLKEQLVAPSCLVPILAALLVSLFPVTAPVSAAAVVSPDGWGWQNPLPQGNALRGVWGSSSSDVFAVGHDGTIIRYDGTAWNTVGSMTTHVLFSVWGTSSSDVFAVGNAGTVLHYDGTTWKS